jgi:hypothetical protein
MNYLAQVTIQEHFLGSSTTPGAPEDVGAFVSSFLSNALVIAGLILLVFMIVGGIGIIGNAGSENPERLEKMKKTIMSAIIGFIVVFCAYWIVQLISKVTGVGIIP